MKFLLIFLAVFFLQISPIKANCTEIYQKNFTEIQKNFRSSYLAQLPKKQDFQEKTKEILTVYELLDCSLSKVCNSLSTTLLSSDQTLDSCPDFALPYDFSSCEEDDQKEILELVSTCSEEKEQALIEERTLLLAAFQVYSEKSYYQLLSARLYTLNQKLRDFSSDFTELQIKLKKLLNKVFCTQE